METTKELVYCGRRMGGDNKLMYMYQNITDPTHPEDAYYTKPIMPGMSVGVVIQLTPSTEGRYWASGPNAPKYLRVHESDDIPSWSAADKVAATMAAEVARNKRINKAAKDPLERHIEALADSVRHMRVYERAAFLKYLEARIMR